MSCGVVELRFSFFFQSLVFNRGNLIKILPVHVHAMREKLATGLRVNECDFDVKTSRLFTPCAVHGAR